jgi:hypothetical protein
MAVNAMINKSKCFPRKYNFTKQNKAKLLLLGLTQWLWAPIRWILMEFKFKQFVLLYAFIDILQNLFHLLWTLLDTKSKPLGSSYAMLPSHDGMLLCATSIWNTIMESCDGIVLKIGGIFCSQKFFKFFLYA